MSPCLHPCPSCAQHLRATETACPFCDAVLPEGFGVCRQQAGTGGRPMSRAALLFVGATVAASCGGSVETGSTTDGGHAADSGGGDADIDAQPVTLYGPGPIFDASRPDARPDAASDAPSTDAPAETGYDGGSAVLYGPAMIDGG